MANLHNRNRVVYVRVSQAEFDQLRDLCARQGARNMSDLVRSAMEQLIRANGSRLENELSERLSRLEESVEKLSSVVAQISVGH